MRRVEFHGPFVGLCGAGHVAFRLGNAAFLVVIFRVVGGHVLQLRQDRFRFTKVQLQPQHAGALQLHLLGRVARFLGPFKRLQRVVVLTPLGMGTPEEERRERPFGLLELFHRVGHFAEEERHDAELEVQLFLLRRLGRRESFRERLVDFLQGFDLRPALGQPFPQLGNHAAFKLFAFHQKCAKINQCLSHSEKFPSPNLTACRPKHTRNSEARCSRSSEYSDASG